MDPRFDTKVLEELVKLVQEEREGRQPSNATLAAAVRRVIRLQNPDL